MRIVRFLIKPIKLLIFLLMISALIYFRSAIFHPNVTQYMDDAVSYVDAQLDIAIPSYVNVDKKAIAETEIECPLLAEIEVIDTDDVATALQPEPVADDESVNELEPVNTTPTSDEESDRIDSLMIAIEAVNKKVDKLAQAREVVTVVNQAPEIERDPQSPASAEEAVSAGDRSVAAVTNAAVKEDAVKEDSKEVLSMARQSFWNGDLSEAERLYQKLIAIDDSDPDVHGEIGNIYYTQGKWKQAGQAYYQAAVRLLAQQNDARMSDQVGYLLRVIQGLDTESAEKLRTKISE